VIVSLGIIANKAPHSTEEEIEKLLKFKAQDMVFLSMQQVVPDILIGLAVAIAICIIIVLTTYIIP
jgi:hypothetical protein